MSGLQKVPFNLLSLFHFQTHPLNVYSVFKGGVVNRKAISISPPNSSLALVRMKQLCFGFLTCNMGIVVPQSLVPTFNKYR